MFLIDKIKKIKKYIKDYYTLKRIFYYSKPIYKVGDEIVIKSLDEIVDDYKLNNFFRVYDYRYKFDANFNDYKLNISSSLEASNSEDIEDRKYKIISIVKNNPKSNNKEFSKETLISYNYVAEKVSEIKKIIVSGSFGHSFFCDSRALFLHDWMIKEKSNKFKKGEQIEFNFE